ncbi:phospholipase D/nuclease [Hypoxylon fuscum]|nr:phospholipase D/nuclease [Hypoxylon fuscum]
MASLSHFKETWKGSLIEHSSTLRDEFPDYHLSDPESLISTSHAHSFQLGTGASIYTNSLLPAILEAKHEVILVTCFWASSSTLSTLKEALEKLAEDRRERIRSLSSPNVDALSPLRIRLCFSSRSLFQKLFHTWSTDGYVYPPSTWATQLGLPSPEILEAGLIDLRVKSLFFLPFSVMHPKFLIVDRQRAWFPSCNISWESWLEGCVEISGEAVAGLLKFYRHVWDAQLDGQQFTAPLGLDYGSTRPPGLGKHRLTSIQSPAGHFVTLPGVATPTVLLPSSHHRNPRYDIIPWHDTPSPPATPLNYAILCLLDMAEHSIYMQTPNLTSTAVINSLLAAVKRGVNVVIVTSKGLMLLEQIVTAGTSTSLCLRSLIRKYQKLRVEQTRLRSHDPEDSEPAIDIEAQRPLLGSLKISYFRSHPENKANRTIEEPVHSHLKLTIVDGQYTVLGSGNMDRASWFTSQELGIMFQSKDLATTISVTVDKVLTSRLNLVFSSMVEN